MFQFSDRHIEEYETQGYTVFRGILPTSLIGDLRRACDRGAELVHERDGAQAQRFQPVSALEIDHRPFQEYTELPAIRDALSRLLSPAHQPAGIDTFGVLLSPAESPWCTAWHRDWRDNMPNLDMASWESEYRNRDLFNQVNCALYEDSCTWVVPGSHARPDTDAEVARFPERPIESPNLKGLTNEEAERACLDYCESMPGAQRLLLDAGDYCLYRNTLWHMGNYIPYRKRATLHDGAMTPVFSKWIKEQLALMQERREKGGVAWENPNANRLAGLSVSA